MTRAVDMPIREREEHLVELEQAILQVLETGAPPSVEELLRDISRQRRVPVDDVAQALSRLSSAVEQDEKGLHLV